MCRGIQCRTHSSTCHARGLSLVLCWLGWLIIKGCLDNGCLGYLGGELFAFCVASSGLLEGSLWDLLNLIQGLVDLPLVIFLISPEEILESWPGLLLEG